LPENAWRRLSAGEGTKGARLHDWAYLDLADLDADNFDAAFAGVWTRGLLIRRNIADGDLAYFSTWCPVGTPLEKLLTVEGHRWAIEDSFETAKNEFGLDHNETRSWHGWHRPVSLGHVSLVMLAFAMMAVIRVSANTPPRIPQKQCGQQDARPQTDPVVDAGNPPDRHAPRTATNSSRPCHHMVALATCSSGSSSTSTHQIQNETVMLAPFDVH